MKETFNNRFDDEIDLKEIFDLLFREKKIIMLITFFISVVGVVYSLLLPNIYQSTSILVPSGASSNISRSLQAYSGLASIANMSIPVPGENDDNSKKAQIKIQSLSFFEKNFLPNIFLPDLMAFRSWNPKSNSIEYNKRIYDQSSENWIRDYSYPKKSIPSSQESFEVFIENHLSLNEDKKTGFITISIKHQSPFIAKKWNEILINEVNAYYRQKDKSESIDVVNYLNEQILLTSFSEVKEAIAQLLQEETQKLALIEAKQSYVFDFIDPPAVMEKKSEPIRAIICILFSTIGVLFSIFFVIIKNYVFKKNLLKS